MSLPQQDRQECTCLLYLMMNGLKGMSAKFAHRQRSGSMLSQMELDPNVCMSYEMQITGVNAVCLDVFRVQQRDALPQRSIIHSCRERPQINLVEGCEV